MAELKDGGITPKPRSEKKKVSMILGEDRDWHNVNDVLPAAGQRVVFRFMTEDAVYTEDEENVNYVEDLKIGRFIRDINDETKGTWVIDPPYPKFDYSPLSDKERLKDNAIVTHWATPSEEDLESWEDRFKPTGDYQRLTVIADPEHESILYHALTLGCRFIRNFAGGNFQGPDGVELFARYAILSDMLACMDSNAQVIDNECIPIDDFVKGEVKLCTPSCPGFVEHGDANTGESNVGIGLDDIAWSGERPSAQDIFDLIGRYYPDETDRMWLFKTLDNMEHRRVFGPHTDEAPKEHPKPEKGSPGNPYTAEEIWKKLCSSYPDVGARSVILSEINHLQGDAAYESMSPEERTVCHG